ncbi:MAG: molybdopterin-dependent oxidoreductase [Chloroflexota bacterium]
MDPTGESSGNERHPQPQPHARRIGRAGFLGLSAATAGALFLGKKLPNLNISALAGGQNVDGFTIYTINGFPSFDPATYRLHVAGLVDKPSAYTYNDLLAMPRVSETRYYQCVTGWVVPSPRWAGVRLWDIVQASHPRPNARALRFLCMDDAYSESLTFEQARQSDVLLAYGLNGKSLSKEQGMPLRLVVPGMYGYKFAKWVNRVQVVDQVYPGYWEQNGYGVDAYIGRGSGA